MRDAGVVVALDGQGADELLWGYTWHYARLLGHLARSAKLPRFLTEVVGILRNSHLRSRARLLVALGYYSFPRARELRSRVLAESALTQACRALAGAPSEQGFASRDLSAFRSRELFADPLPSLLRYEDRNSMAASVESRLPFLDYRLVELALAVPERELIRDGWTKALLREAMNGLLPERIRWRRSKLGFDAPSSRMFGDISPLVRDAFQRPRVAGLISPKFVLDRLDSRAALPTLAMRAILAEFWMREFAVGLTGAPGRS